LKNKIEFHVTIGFVTSGYVQDLVTLKYYDKKVIDTESEILEIEEDNVPDYVKQVFEIIKQAEGI
jgi:hypothetical protein